MTANNLYQSSFVWDDHCGFVCSPDASLDTLISPWRDAGVDYLSINVGFDPEPWTRTLDNIAALRRRLPLEIPYCRIVSTVADIDAAVADGKLAVTFDIEGMTALNGRTDWVQLYYDLGVRHMLFAYNRNNDAGSGCHDDDTGLTPFGRDVIHEMNRVGMVIDCSHTGCKTTMDAMEQSSSPVVFSHSNPKALADHDRNITDDQIKACAQTGGVIGVNGINLFLGTRVTTADDVARHAAYIAELTAPEHVGISLDYAPDLDADLIDSADSPDDSAIHELLAGHPEYWPTDAGYDTNVRCLDVQQLPAVADALLQIGFSNTEVTGVLGGNFRRVADAVWK